MMVIGIVGFVFDFALRLVQRRILHWVPVTQASLQK
jgi:ABC-type nitrate/sulfonate/bicarbonate transport system permease component